MHTRVLDMRWRQTFSRAHVNSDSSAFRSNFNSGGSKMRKAEGTIWMLEKTATWNTALEAGIWDSIDP